MEEFSMEYVEPKVLCVSIHGRFADDRYVTAAVVLAEGDTSVFQV